MDELLAAATHKSSREIKKLLAERFPHADVPTRVRTLPSARAVAARESASREWIPVAENQDELSLKTVAGITQASVLQTEEHLRTELSPGTVEAPARPAKVEPIAPKRYSLQLTMCQEMHDKLRHAQALLSHSLPSGDVTQVLERALDALVAKLEKAKFAATDRPRMAKEHASASPRLIPAHTAFMQHKRREDSGRGQST